MTNSPNPTENPNESRLLPFAVAGLLCFVAALILGVGGWYALGTNRRLAPEKNAIAVQISNQNSPAANANLNSNVNAAASTPQPLIAPEIVKAPAGEIAVDGGEVALGGGDTKLPVRRVAVAPFAIAETEVTNEQYAQFVEETGHRAPTEWKNGKFPSGAASEPVVGVSWADANDYCEWLSVKIGANVRLPNEAEWELAARGANNFIYPWGNEWSDEAAESFETKAKIRPVKSFPKGRTPSGIYDLIGNVFEWTSDLYVDEFGKPILREKSNQRVIKGGSFGEDRKVLTVKLRYYRPENEPSQKIGFRYAVVRK